MLCRALCQGVPVTSSMRGCSWARSWGHQVNQTQVLCPRSSQSGGGGRRNPDLRRAAPCVQSTAPGRRQRKSAREARVPRQLEVLLQEAAPSGPRSRAEALWEPTAAEATEPGRGLSSATCQLWDFKRSSTFLYLICEMETRQRLLIAWL